VGANEKFDWVKERAKCSPFVVFQQLKYDIDDDVRKRNEMRTIPPTYGFKTIPHNSQAVSVVLEGNMVEKRSVIFRCTEVGIDFQQDDKPLVKSTLTLNGDGACCLKIEDCLYSFWQFRQKALEKLLFEIAPLETP
jgi:hypothetical protein